MLPRSMSTLPRIRVPPAIMRAIRRVVMSDSEEPESDPDRPTQIIICCCCVRQATDNDSDPEEEDMEDDTDSEEPQRAPKRRREKPSAHDQVDYDDEEYAFFTNASATERARIRSLERAVKAGEPSDAQVPWRFRILGLPIPPRVKKSVLEKLDALKRMDPSSGEYQKLNNWMCAFMRLPLGRYTPLLSPKRDVPAFLARLTKTMDSEVYGHQEAKRQLLGAFAKWISNPAAPGLVMGIQGPPGVGKTTLIKDGVCRALDLPYAFIPLGGANDSSFLDGHSYTYEGSTWGRVAAALMEAGCSNPVLVFDELDKVACNVRGGEVYNVLMQLTDPAQNEACNDKYFGEIPIDLSKCIIVFTYNDETNVHPVLLDRMVRLRTADYSKADKLTIMVKHMLPKLLTAYGMTDQVTIPESTVEFVVGKVGGSGMRDIKRAFESMLGHLNVLRLVGDEAEKIAFPCDLTRSMAEHLLKSDSALLENAIPDSVAHIYM